MGSLRRVNMNSLDFSYDWQFAYAQNEEWSNQHTNFKYAPVNLPHDFKIGLERTENSFSGASEGFYPGGIGYYKKTFHVDKKMLSQRVLLYFDGVYRMCEVRLNRNLITAHKGGYTGFFAELTGHLVEGENTIHVKVNASLLPASRWYTGAGIYRKVTLYTGSIPSLEPWGTSIETLPNSLSVQNADVRIRTQIFNPRGLPCNIRYEISDLDGNPVAEKVVTNVIHDSDVVFNIPYPKLWDVDSPSLYTLYTSLETDGDISSPSCIKFGIRTIEVDAKKGLRINGKQVLLKGGCVHHDNGLLGSASYPVSEWRKVKKLKENGYNAIRCAHNPPSTAFLDACDQLGMYVIDEAFDCWREGKKLNDEHIFFETHWKEELQSMILRDRNHPCVIMWSTGNEIVERSGLSDGAAWSKKLADAVREIDRSRPVTNALCGFFEDQIIAEMEANIKSTTGEGKDYWASRSEKFCEPLDVVGYNYLLDRYEKDNELYPQRVIVGSESFPLEAFDNWSAVEKLSHVIGDFVWTAWDYLGESGIGHSSFEGEARGLKPFPWHVANCGDLDICGRKRPQSHYRDFLWNGRKKPYIAVQHPKYYGKQEGISPWGWPDLLESWSFPDYEGRKIKVVVYSSGDQVALFLNSQLIGTKPCGKATKYVQEFEVDYIPGELTVVAYEHFHRS
jgi:beta-galactosidase